MEPLSRKGNDGAISESGRRGGADSSPAATALEAGNWCGPNLAPVARRDGADASVKAVCRDSIAASDRRKERISPFAEILIAFSRATSDRRDSIDNSSCERRASDKCSEAESSAADSHRERSSRSTVTVMISDSNATRKRLLSDSNATLPRSSSSSRLKTFEQATGKHSKPEFVAKTEESGKVIHRNCNRTIFEGRDEIAEISQADLGLQRIGTVEESHILLKNGAVVLQPLP